jgi:cell division septum initiation protein DivIVA
LRFVDPSGALGILRSMSGASAGHENGIQHPDGEEQSPIGGEERAGPRTPTTTTASERVRDANFPVAMRGYDRRTVDEYVAELTELVDELEGRQLREKVVQRALDEVGEQTAGILQQAHETADELSARSRAQAEGRLQRAEREAELAKTEADRYAEQVAVEIRRLWEERNQLIEDVRRLADDVLATADEAAERLKTPEAVAAALPPADAVPGEADTAPLAPTPLRSVEQLQPAPVAGDEAP